MSNIGPNTPSNSPLKNTQGLSHKLINSIFHYIDIDPEPFKTETLLEALNRRIALSLCSSMDQYLKIIIDNSIERKELINNLIFKTPSIFNNEITLKVFNEKVTKDIIDNNTSKNIKIWVPLCGSGLSVVSLAVLMEDNLIKQNKTFRVYATDINKETILKASTYQLRNTQEQIPHSLVGNYFNEENNECKIKPNLRKKILYAKVDFLGPQIIQNIDLIYITDNFKLLKPEYQDKLIEVFNQSLNPNGLILFDYLVENYSSLIKNIPDYPVLYGKKLTRTVLPEASVLNVTKEPDIKHNELKKECHILIDNKLYIKHITKGLEYLVQTKKVPQNAANIFNQESCDILSNTINTSTIKTNAELPLVLTLTNNSQKIFFLVSTICNGELYILKTVSKSVEKAIPNTPEYKEDNNNSHLETDQNAQDNNVYEERINDDLSSLNEQMRSKIISLEKNALQQENTLNNLEVGYLLLDNQLKIEKINTKVRDFFHLNDKDLTKYVYDAIPQFENHLLIEQLLDVLRNGKTIKKEISWLDNRLFRLVFSSTVDAKINVFIYDISDHLKNEEIAHNQYITLLKFIDKSSCILYSRNLEKNLRIKCITHNVAQLTGHTSEEFVKNKDLFLNLIHPNDVDLLEKGYELLSKYGHYEIVYRLINDKNDCIWIHDEMQVVVSNGEKIVVGTWRDITAQKIRDLAYRESEKRYKSLFDHTSDIVVSINIKGEIEYVNNAFMEALGFPSDKISTLKIEDIVHTEHLAEFHKTHEQVFSGKTTSEFETSFISPNKERYQLKGQIHPYYAGHKIIAAQCILKITPLNTNTPENISLLKTTIDSTDDSICTVDINLKYLTFNKAYASLHNTIFNEEPKIGIRENTVYQKNWLKALEGEKFSIVEEFAIDNKNRFFDIKFGPIKNHLDEIIGAQQNCREITELFKNQVNLYQTLSNLQESNKELEHFTYIVTHDLRGPVINLKGLLEIFERKHFVNNENEYIYKRISSSTEQIHETLKDLSEIISLGQSKFKNIEYIDFKTLTSKIEEILNPQINKTQTTILKDFTETKGINYQLAHLKSIFLNIISNAIKYQRKGINPIIKVKSTIEGQFTCISFEDNGMGVDDSKKGEIFGMFQRLNEDIEGKGLGLYITKSQLESQGGKIEITSKLGMGSTFKIYLKDQKSLDTQNLVI